MEDVSEDDVFIDGEPSTATTAAKNLDDLIELRFYCFMVLVMAEILAFTALASVTMMVFAAATTMKTGI
ncbi:unnamed protein product [Caenorhabditis bovis]|uniref:Uncharacterized protein n=1 Tax=Caenorhabditis bovis TaxID=2654633 RepID=A0A8S1F9U7_9PELO|nr:unnamed protein product [Caenorhabditis bovis]